METASIGRDPRGGKGRQRRASWLVDRQAMAIHLRALRAGSAEIARLVRFAAGVLWRASPLLTLALLILGATNGLAPLLQVWATTHLIDSLTRTRSSSLIDLRGAGTP